MSPSLTKAIKLREWARVSIDKEDTDTMRRLIRMADDAAQALSPTDLAKYNKWCWDSLGPGKREEILSWWTRLTT